MAHLKPSVSPSIIAFETTGKVVIENQIILPGVNQMYRLCGIVYYHSNHFVCRFIDKSGGVWYHDGIETKSNVLYYDNVVNYSGKKLQTTGSYTMCLLLYTVL